MPVHDQSNGLKTSVFPGLFGESPDSSTPVEKLGQEGVFTGENRPSAGDFLSLRSGRPLWKSL
jgi:hypothetical protein